MAEERLPYRTLDGIRGIAATIVMTRHLPGMFGQFTFPRCYLAVDLFFVLSGFVIANAYQARLESGMGLGAFMRVRFIRFYPFFALALLLGIVDVLLEMNLGSGRDWTSASLAIAIAAGMLMLPAPGSPEGVLYPINGPCWSLGFELWVNALYGLIHRWLTTKVLLAIMAVSALGVLRYFAYFGSVNFGDSWDTLLSGAVRVCYSFFAGVLIWRWRGARTTSTIGSVAIALIVGLLLISQVEAMPFDLIVVMVGFPALVWLAARVEPGAAVVPVFINLGLASYGVYVIHTPIGHMIERLAKANGYVIPIPYPGIGFIIAITLLVLWLDKHFDQPLRRWLTRGAIGSLSKQREAKV
jgi:peptidoglycan/LPS O-acetylase OafA/YrhL